MDFLLCLQLLLFLFFFVHCFLLLLLLVRARLFYFIFRSFETTTVIFEESIFVSLNDEKTRTIQAFDEAWKNVTHVEEAISQKKIILLLLIVPKILYAERLNISDVNFILLHFCKLYCPKSLRCTVNEVRILIKKRTSRQRSLVQLSDGKVQNSFWFCLSDWIASWLVGWLYWLDDLSKAINSTLNSMIQFLLKRKKK